MPDLDKASSSGSLWDEFSSEDEQLFREVKLPEDDTPGNMSCKAQADICENNDGEEYESQWDSLVADWSKAKVRALESRHPLHLTPLPASNSFPHFDTLHQG